MIEIPTISKVEERWLARMGKGLPAVYHRVINRPLGIRERLLQTRVLMSIVDHRKSTFHFSWPRGLSELTLEINTEEDGDSSVGLSVCPRRPRLVQVS